MIERAEIGGRPKMTAEDRAKYNGIAQHPLARRWMLRKLLEATDKLEAAKGTEQELRWSAEVKKLHSQLKRGGIDLGSAA